MKAARKAFRSWSRLAGRERAKYLYRIARIIQERSRELAVAESLDGGKPIRESRDVDLPLSAAHFFYYAGWADKLEYAFPNRTPRPVGVAAQIIPWNFPLLMLAWKIAPALACGNTVVLKPAETTPLTALIFADICRQAELPPGVVNVVTGDGTTGGHLVRHPDIDKVAFTGSTEVGKLIMKELAGRNVKLTLELGGKAANIVFDDAALDQAVEGIVNGIYFNQGHVCCAGSRLLAQESIYEPLIDKLKRRLTTLRVGDPLDKNTDVGAINSKAQLDRITELVASGEAEGAEIYQPECKLPERGLLVRADALHERRAEPPHRAGGDLRAGALGADVPDARGGGREGEQHGVRAVGRRVDGEGVAHPVDGRAAARGGRVGEHVQPVRPDVAVRRLQGVRLRPRGRAARPRAVPEVRMTRLAPRSPPRPHPGWGVWPPSTRCRSYFGSACERHTPACRFGVDRSTTRPHRRRAPAAPRDMTRLPVKKTYKLYVGGQFPRSESGRTYEAEGHNVSRASRKDARDAVRAARAALPSWSGATAYNRGQVLYRLAEMMEARRPDLERVSSGRKEVEAAIDRVIWYAGWCDKLAQVLGGANPVAGPYFDFTVPEPTGVVAILAPAEPALGGFVTRVSLHSSAATPSSPSPPSSTRWPRSSSRRRSPRPTSRAA